MPQPPRPLPARCGRGTIGRRTLVWIPPIAASRRAYHPGRPVANHLSFGGASELAARIRDFWKVQGYEVEIVIERFAIQQRTDGFAVRSNLFNGSPR
jgi:hypothetical protein